MAGPGQQGPDPGSRPMMEPGYMGMSGGDVEAGSGGGPSFGTGPGMM